MVGGCVVVWFIVFSLRLHSMIGRNEKMNDASDCKCRERPRGSRMIARVVTRRTGAELPSLRVIYTFREHSEGHIGLSGV